MTSLAAALEDYLAIRQGLGVRLIVPAGLLRRFVAFVNHAGSDVITTELALRWATHPQGIQPSTSAWRLGIVRRFAAWRQTTDHRTEIPPKGLLPDRYRRQAPYIYTDAEVRSLLTAARDLPSTHRLRGQTYATLFGLLAVTGLRLGEALTEPGR